MSRALVLVCGLSEVMLCTLILDRLRQQGRHLPATLVLYGARVSMPNSLRHETLERAGLFGDWAEIIDFCDETDLIQASGEKDRAEVIALVRDRLGPSGVDLILTHSIDKQPERGILAAFPAAPVLLYDNGIQSHLTREVSMENAGWKQARIINAADLARVEEAQFTLGGLIGMPGHLATTPQRPFGPDEYRQGLESLWPRLRRLPEFSVAFGAERPLHLLLGSAMHRTPFMTYEEERAVHVDFADQVLRSSVEDVLYKSKPRQHEAPYLEAGGRVRRFTSNIAAEFLPLAFNIVSVASMHSTALLTLPWLYGVPAHRLDGGAQLAERMPHVKLLIEEVDRHAKGLVRPRPT